MATNQINFGTVVRSFCLPSLEDVCLLAIVKHVMETERDEIRKIFIEHVSLECLFLNLPNEKVSQLISVFMSVPIPEVLEEKFLSLIHWIIDQYREYINFVLKEIAVVSEFFEKQDSIANIVNAVVWNVNGTINYQGTKRQLLKYVAARCVNCQLKIFKIASEHCSVGDIKLLWKKMHPVEKKNLEEEVCTKYCAELYWVSLLRGEAKKFLKFAADYMKQKGGRYQEILESEIAFLNNADNFGFALAILEGSPSTIMHFCKKLTSMDEAFLVHLIEIYIRRIGCQELHSHENTNILYYLLNKINDHLVLERLFEQYFMIFLRLSLKQWLCHKFLGDLVKMSMGDLDYIMFYELLTTIIGGIKEEDKYKLLLVKSLWRNISNDVKKSFCLFISKITRENLDMLNLWRYMTIDLLDVFLKDETFKNFSSPHENNGIVELIMVEKFEVVNFWLEKYLLSKEAIVSFKCDLVLTKSVEIFENMQKRPIDHIMNFIDWGFEYEEVMNKDKVLQIKDKAAEYICVSAFVKGIESHKWEDLEKLTDWILSNRDDQEDKLINYKKKALQGFLLSSYKIDSWDGVDFVKSLNRFLRHGVNDEVKLRVMIQNVQLYEIPSRKWLSNDWLRLESFLIFLFEHGRDIMEIKQNTFHNILSTYGEHNFENQSYYQNVERFLNWNLEKDPTIKKKIWEIKKFIIENCACRNITRCVYKNWSAASNNILNCLFKERDQEKDYAKMVFNLKKSIIEDLSRSSFWKTDYHYSAILRIVNWGKNDQNIKNDIWNTKIYLIDRLKDTIESEMIPDLIVGEKKNFIPSIFADHQNDVNFDSTLWRLKEFLIKKIVMDDDDTLIFQMFEKFEYFDQFLKWNGFNETGLNNLKKLIYDRKGVKCCLHWISNDKFSEIKHFLDWYDSNMIFFKNMVLRELAGNSTLVYRWSSLKYFLDYKFDFNLEQDKVSYSLFKKTIAEMYSLICPQICYNWILQNQWLQISHFLIWVYDSLYSKRLIELKSWLIEEKGAKYCNARIFENDWEKIEKFLTWCFEPFIIKNEREEKITNLKIKTFEEDICYKNNLDIVLRFLKWGFTSQTQLKKFKKSIFEKTHPLNFFVSFEKYKSQKDFQLWFVN